jgi:hypothetical protein
MPDLMQSAMLRRWAMECAAEADNPRHNAAQRERLLKMRAALLELALTQDWLAGRSPQPKRCQEPPQQQSHH